MSVIRTASSLTGLRRLQRASIESRDFATFGYRLMKRGIAFKSLAVGMPWPERLKLANAARARNRLARQEAAAKQKASRPYAESTRDL